MAKQSVDVLIEGGKATAAPPLGPALGPLGVNIGQVVVDINKKTASFKGMQVPVKVTVDSDTKAYEISIGTPPASALIKKEAGIPKGAGNAKTDIVADLRIEQVIKVATMKEDSLLGKDLKEKVKEIIGTCRSMGVKVMGVSTQEALIKLNAGEWDTQINNRSIEVSEEDLAELEKEKKLLKANLEKNRAKFTVQANDVLVKYKSKPAKEQRTRMADAGIPQVIIDELVPPEKKK